MSDGAVPEGESVLVLSVLVLSFLVLSFFWRDSAGELLYCCIVGGRNCGWSLFLGKWAGLGGMGEMGGMRDMKGGKGDGVGGGLDFAICVGKKAPWGEISFGEWGK